MLSDNARAFLRASQAFIIDLGAMRGYNEQAFEDLRSSLQACREEWASLGTVPKAVVATLVELPHMTETASYNYGPEKAEQIRDAAGDLSELILEAVAVSGDLLEDK